MRSAHRVERPHEFGRETVRRYEEAIRERLGSAELFWEAAFACRQLARVASELNNADGLKVAARLTCELFESVASEFERAPGFLGRACELMEQVAASAKGQHVRPEVERLASAVEDALGFWSHHWASYNQRDGADSLGALEKLLGKDTTQKRALARAD